MEGDRRAGGVCARPTAPTQLLPAKDALSALIDALNEQFGLNLTEADRIWFEQQRAAVLERDDLRVVAINNDRDGYRLVLDKFAEGAIIDRHEANEVLFDKFFMDDAFRARFMAYLEATYDDFNATGETA